eukprot:5054227-Prymnesium_polylepis.1
MNGQGDCSQIFSDATALALRGAAAAPAQCDWTDDSTLVAFLSMYTNAGPSMAITVRANVLWPRAWAYPGTCSGLENYCATAIAVTVDRDFPCDRRDTVEVEPCLVPTAVIQGPSELSSCPGTSVTLDASNSVGGGAKALSFQFAVHPTRTDRASVVSASLEAIGSSSKVTLARELDGGSTFVFALRVSNFLGQTSAPVEYVLKRAPKPIPTITIAAPPLLMFRAATSITLSAAASLASCFAAAKLRIEYTWTNYSLRVLPTAPPGALATPLALDARTSQRRNLEVEGSTLAVGLVYTLRVKGCMAAQPDVCGAANVDIGLADEPLQGNIEGGEVRSVGADSAFVLSACATAHDPDESNAELAFLWSSSAAGIDFSTAPPAPPLSPLSANSSGSSLAAADDGGSCSITVAASTLAPGNYTFYLSVVKRRTGETVNSSAIVQIEGVPLPIVQISPLAAKKQNPNAKLILLGSAVSENTMLAAAGYLYEWS